MVIGFEKIYQKLGVTLTERGESFYQSMMSETVKDLESKGVPSYTQHMHESIPSQLQAFLRRTKALR